MRKQRSQSVLIVYLLPWKLLANREMWVGVLIVAASVAAMAVCDTAGARDPMPYDDLDSLLDLDPYLPIPPIRRIFPQDVVPLWNEALRAPEADLQRRAAGTIAYAASLGMKGLDVCSGNLQALAKDGQQPIVVRLAAARALVELDDVQSADAVWAVYEAAGADRASFLVRPLARWQHPGARAYWLHVLADDNASSRHVVQAADGLGALQESSAKQFLLARLLDAAQPAPVRLAAARSLAEIDRSGLLPVAQQLAYRGGPLTSLDRLLAAELLQEHTGPEVVQFLVELTSNPAEPAVISSALKRLSVLDLRRVADLAPGLLTHPDSSVRRPAVLAVSRFPSQPHIELLAPVLQDPHPELRVLARQALQTFATEHGFEQPVIEAAMKVLAGEDWRGIEQAARLVAVLDHKPAAARLVEVLEMPRGEASITAAWALRKLAVRDTLPDVLRHASRGPQPGEGDRLQEYDLRVSQLVQLFAVCNYREAEPQLARLIPKNLTTPEARAAAVWTLGHFYANQPDNPYVDRLVERLSDVQSQPPEHDRVRQMCAVSLGRMKAASALNTLRHFYKAEGSNMPTGLACGWAIQQITGEPHTPASQIYLYRQGWFLTPWNSSR